MNDIDIPALAENHFLDCDSDQLKQIAKTLDDGFKVTNQKDETLRKFCCDQLGLPYSPRTEPGSPAMREGNQKVAPLNMLAKLRGVNDRYWVRRMPQLLARAPWEGRRRRVILSEGEHLKRGTVAILAWDAWPVEIQPGEIVSISYPHFEALKNTYISDSSQKLITNASGKLESRFESYKRQTYPYTDLGDDPETAEKPKSVTDWLQTQARARAYFAKEPRDVLITIKQMLTDTVIPRSTLKDVEDDEIRLDVLVLLSLYDEALEAELLGEDELQSEQAGA